MIRKTGKEEAEEISAPLNEPHNHDFEELIIGLEGEMEHFIDFKSEILSSPFISFVIKGKMHRVKPLVNEKAGYSINGKINRKDWGLNWNAAMEPGGVLVSDDVRINCEVELVRQCTRINDKHRTE